MSPENDQDIDKVVSDYLSGDNAPSEGVDLAPAEPVVPAEPAEQKDLDAVIDAKFKGLSEDFSKREGEYKQTIDKQSRSIEKLEALVGGAYAQAHQPADQPVTLQTPSVSG